MTLLGLAVAWLTLAVLVRPPRTSLGRMQPRAQAVAALAATLGMALMPLAFALTALSTALSRYGGLRLPSCGRLVLAILSDPIARPDLTLSLVVVGVAPFGLLRGITSAWRSQSACRALSRRGRGPIVVLPTSRPVAFTAGFLRPRIVVSSGLVSATASDLGRVVLAHEEAHRRGRHPLLLFVVSVAAKAVPLPPVRWGADALRYALETAADDRAVRETASREFVAEAVATVALESAGAGVGFGGDEVRRVRRLLDPARTSRVGGPVLVAAVLTVLVFASGHTVHCASESARLLATSQCRPH